jgi:adenylate kinase
LEARPTDKIVIVTGIPGSGKSTVCCLVEKLVKEAGIKACVINYGTVMMGILGNHGRSLERDAMRKDDLNTQRELQNEVAKVVSERMKHQPGIKIIDTHMSIKTPEGYLPGLPFHVLQVLKPEMLVLVEAKPRDIYSRRMKDASRNRDEATEKAVEEELFFSRLMVGACAVLAGAPIRMVVNGEGKQEEAATEIVKALGVIPDV